MKKILPYILIVVIVFANILAPISVGWNSNKGAVIEKNTVEADDGGIKFESQTSVFSNQIKVTAKAEWSETSGGVEGIRITVKDSSGNLVGPPQIFNSNSSSNSITAIFSDNIKPSTQYNITAEARQIARLQTKNFSIIWNFSNLWDDDENYDMGITEGSLYEVRLYEQIKTLDENATEWQNGVSQTAANEEYLLEPYSCDILDASTWKGCVGRFLYVVVFEPTAFLFGLTGKLFDFAFFYSVQNTSYSSTFVVEGWKIVRDFCNMFFIFILLYIAFATILNLNSFDTKKMIINVVLIGLLINFSLFATRVIIDASNILARVFYNQETIVIGDDKDGNGSVINSPGTNGEIRLSEAIVSKINPQTIIMNANKAGDGTTASPGTFILIVIMASVVNIVGLITFLSAALVFVARVIGLWMAMILAPLAFFSYTVPKLQEVDTIGWKKWWPETLKLAFLAPVFMFFIYIIIRFLSIAGEIIGDADSKQNLEWILAVIVPFIFIIVLFNKAKDVAKNMSGKMGQGITNAISKAGAIAGGVALGAGAGLLAKAGTATLGRAGAAIADSKNLASAEAKGGIKGWGAKQLRSFGKTAGSGSMDIRGVKVAGKGLADTGLKNLGTAKQGGFVEFQEKKDKERKERADELKNILTGDEKNKITKSQIKLKETMLARKPELDDVDKDIAKTRQEMRDAKDGGDFILSNKKLAELKRLQSKRDVIRSSTRKILSWEDYMDIDGYVKTRPTPIGGLGDEFKDSEGNILESIDKAEELEKKALRELSKAENTSLNTIASSMTTKTSKVVNAITSLGKDTSSSIDKTAEEIRAGGKKADRDKGDTGK
ncbi:MAG: hypothetical protein PHT84_01800 [Candidatus Pacebacteria bacterium]|nr:hypothetical protein [Candidatus Paceibacterota bacterium]